MLTRLSLGLLLVVALTCFCAAEPIATRLSAASDEVAERPPNRPATASAESNSDAARVPGTRRPAIVLPAETGIRCPDGTCLPLLNGVASAPAIIRAAEHGPVPPVLAIVVDAEGFEWYEHLDGSMTTCRPQVITDEHGQSAIQIITLHTTDLPADGSIRELPYPDETRR